MKFPDMDQKTFIASPASGMSHEVVEETVLILQENLRDLLLELGVPVSRWVFSVPDLLQKFDSSICDWKNNFSIFFGKYHLFCIEYF